MTNTVRRLSPDEAAAQAKALALEFAKFNGIEGSLLIVRPDSTQSQREGKIPVHWSAVFTSVHKGEEFDGPTVLLIDLQASRVAFGA